jgi:hypothetical protein
MSSFKLVQSVDRFNRMVGVEVWLQAKAAPVQEILMRKVKSENKLSMVLKLQLKGT